MALDLKVAVLDLPAALSRDLLAPEILAIPVDASDEAEVERGFKSLQDSWGGLDILVNSASVFSAATADDATPDHWDLQLDTNAKAPFFFPPL